MTHNKVSLICREANGSRGYIEVQIEITKIENVRIKFQLRQLQYLPIKIDENWYMI